MIKKIAAFTSALLIAAACTAPLLPEGTVFGGTDLTAEAADTAIAANPVIFSDVPDCDVIRVGDTYYMVSTTMFFSPGAPIMKSKDLVSWEICSYVYDTLADGDVQNLTNGKHDYAHGQWAASLRYNKGTFYVFFGSYGTGKSYIYKTDDIENGTWTRTELNGMYHDASMLFDDDGRNYLVYGGGGEIKIKEFNSEMTDFKWGGLDKTLFKTGLDGLAGEGSHIQKIGDYYYVFVIAWPSGSGRIELCYRSKSLEGAFEGKTVLNSGVGTYGSGVAQGGIVDTPDGEWYGLLFQDHGAIGRIPVLVPVTWENGYPMMGVNGKAPVTFEVEGGYTGTSLAKSDDFSYDSDDLKLEWQWNHNPDNTAWSVTERDGWLRLKNKCVTSNFLFAKNTLTQRTEGPSCSSVIKLDTKGMKAGDRAGLSAFQLNYGNVGVLVDDSGAKKVYMSKNGGSEVATSSDKIIEQANMTGDEVYLKVEFTFNTVDGNMNVSNNIDKANFFYSFDGSSWTKIGDTLGMTYDLKLFTGYRSGIYSYSTKSTGGYVDVDFFDYQRAEWNAPTIVEPDPDGYFFHHTFEGTTEKWSGRGPATVQTSGRVAYAGKEALLVQDRESEWNGAIYTLGRSFKAGEEYSFSVNTTYADGDDTRDFKLTLEYVNADDETTWDEIASGTTSAGQWLQLANTNYRIPDGASNCKIIVETTDDTIENFYIDEAIGAPAGTVIDGAGVPNVVVKKYMLGDTDFDGRITALDMVNERKAVAKKITDAKILKNADVDKDGVVNTNDLVLLQSFILGKISEFPDNRPTIVTDEEEKTAYEYKTPLVYKEAPSSYFSADGCKGKLINETYTGINGQKKLNVYLPPNYDKNKKYNVFYLMHGGGENENVLVNDKDKFYIHYMVDHMIQNGEVEPMILVFPTFNGCPDGAGDVWDEMKQSIVPFVEGKYSTYAENTTPAGLEASRMHRAYGGFSMGGGSTWNVLINDNDYFAYYMPLSGHCWGGATPILNIMKNHKYKDKTYILAATGTEDIAYDNMCGLINELKKDSSIKFTPDFSKGNFYFLEAQGKTHWWGFVKHYVYDALPYFFHE